MIGIGALDISPQGLPAVVTGPRSFRGRVIGMEPEMGDSVLITVTAPPPMVKQLRAGRFFQVLCREERFYDPLLRRPFSVITTDPHSSTITFLVRPYGRGSTWLIQRAIGDEVDIIGPLGNAYEFAPRATNLLMVAGGVGVAPLAMLTEEANARGLSVTFLMGATSETGLLSASRLPAEVEYVVATENGSRGHQGFITDLLPEYAAWADQIFACGPEPMYRSMRTALLNAKATVRNPIQISMEQSMACGLGTCLGCVVETRRGMRTSCVDGPVFAIEELVW